MRPNTWNVPAWRILLAVFATALLCAVQAAPKNKPNPPQPNQKTFSTPDEAGKALIQAADNYDLPALLEILGPDGKDLLASQDPVQDKNRATEFVAMAQQKVTVTTDATRRRAELTVGNDAWPLPIPIVESNGKWYFDTKAGRQEILYRRIGENELNAITICRGYVEAQLEYAAAKHDGSQVNEYAQQIVSSPGKQDGLAWQNSDGSWGGPVGEKAAEALQQGYRKGQPYHGYYFKVLKGQGPAARMGRIDFVVEGAMIGGFALIASPAQYRVTGVKSFIVSQDGTVYEKDLGPNTLTIFKNTEVYNPDKTWRPTEDEE